MSEDDGAMGETQPNLPENKVGVSGDSEDGEPIEGGSSANEAEQAGDISFDSERRMAYRLNKVLGANLTSLAGEVKSARLFIIDISVTGFRATDHSPHKEEFYDIEVTLAKGLEPFRSRMRVVWTKELTVSGMFQMGCEFVDTAGEEVVKLESFIDKERRKVEPKSAPTNLGRPWTMIH